MENLIFSNFATQIYFTPCCDEKFPLQVSIRPIFQMQFCETERAVRPFHWNSAQSKLRIAKNEIERA